MRLADALVKFYTGPGAIGMILHSAQHDHSIKKHPKSIEIEQRLRVKVVLQTNIRQTDTKQTDS